MEGSIVFEGFEPEDGLRSEIERAFDGLIELSPYGATARLRLATNGSRYLCEAEIAAVSGSWHSRADCKTPQTAFRHAVASVEAQLRRWRASRFSGDTINRLNRVDSYASAS